MYLIDRYLDSRTGRERPSQRGANTQESRGTHDPLLYMAMGYMAAQSRDSAMQYLAGLVLINYLAENRPSNHPGARRNFETRLEKRVVLHREPIHYNLRQNPNYMNR